MPKETENTRCLRGCCKLDNYITVSLGKYQNISVPGNYTVKVRHAQTESENRGMTTILWDSR